ncbi:MAG: GtrA family protein [Gemmataceae bacterium]
MPPPSSISFGQRLLIFLRSGIVGLLATVSDLGSLAMMVRVFGWSPQAANVPSLFLGLIVIFVGNKYFAFRDRSRGVLKQGGKFLLIEIGAILLNILFFHLLVTFTGLVQWPEVARLIGTNVTYLGFSYPLWSIFVFRPETTPETESPAVADSVADCVDKTPVVGLGKEEA